MVIIKIFFTNIQNLELANFPMAVGRLGTWMRITGAPDGLNRFWLRITGAPDGLNGFWLRITGVPDSRVGKWSRVTGVPDGRYRSLVTSRQMETVHICPLTANQSYH